PAGALPPPAGAPVAGVAVPAAGGGGPRRSARRAPAAVLEGPPPLRSKARLQTHGRGKSRPPFHGRSGRGLLGRVRADRRPPDRQQAGEVPRARSGDRALARADRGHAPARPVRLSIANMFGNLVVQATE